MAKQRKMEKLDGLERYNCFASINWDWAPKRLPDVPVMVTPNAYKEGQHLTTRKGTMGHQCLYQGCEGVLQWAQGNVIDPKGSGYWVWCPSCMKGYLVSAKYMWPMLKEALENFGAEAPEAPEEDTQEAQEGPEDAPEVSQEPPSEPEAPVAEWEESDEMNVPIVIAKNVPDPVRDVDPPVKRKGGRPKGSKNKPKDDTPQPVPGQMEIPGMDVFPALPPSPTRKLSSLF